MTPAPHRSVLVVDDSRLILEMVRDAFADAGLDVETAANGEEALHRALARRPDLIVSDVLMPVMDGWALFEALQRHPELRAVPFIFLTSETEARKRVKGLRLGAFDYLTKPFSVEELLLRVQRILERRQGARERQERVLAGHTSHLPLADLLQLLSGNARTGVLTLRAGAEGRVMLREGRIVRAEAGGVEGKKALFRLLGWPESRFVFEPVDVPPREDEIEGETATLVMDGLVDIDEAARYRDDVPEDAVRLAVRADARRRVIEEGMSALEFEITRTAKQGLTVREIVDRCSAPDGLALRTLHALIERGVLETASARAAREASESDD